MTVARASCICERCGKEFEVVTKRPNRRDADNFEVWAERNITVCPECVRAEMEEEHLREAEDAKKKAGDEMEEILSDAVSGKETDPKNA